MLRRFARKLAVTALAVGLALPLGTVLCVHDGGHASLEAAGLGRCGDSHDSEAHDSSTHMMPAGESDAPCVDTVVEAGELRSAPATDSGLIALVAEGASVTFLPPIRSDATGAAYRAVAERSCWTTACVAGLGTTVVLC
jgi:hypothetical protein